MNVLVLIPPSEGKVSGGEQKPLEHVRDEVVSVQKSILTAKHPEKLYGVKKALAFKAHELNKTITTTPTMPAIKRYSGVVYKAIDYDSLSAKAKSFFHVHFRILSPMFGLVKPNERIPEYKMKFSKLKLDAYWKPILSKKLESFFIIDLLAKEQRKAVYYENGIRVDFQLKQDGVKRAAGHFGKHIKGRFIRFMCEHSYTNIDDLATFSEDGFSCVEKSDEYLMFEKEL